MRPWSGFSGAVRRTSALVAVAATIGVQASSAVVAGTGMAILGPVSIGTAVAASGPALEPATGGGAIPADSALASPGSGTYTMLAGPALDSATGGDLAGTLTLTVPAGFRFAAGSGAVAISGAGCGDLAVSSGPVVTPTTVTLSTTGTTQAAPCALSFQGLQVAPTAGRPLAGGPILASGLASGDAGDLLEVAGTASVLAFSVEPAGTATGGVPFGTQPQVTDSDQFGNPRAGASVSLGIATATTGGATATCAVNPAGVDATGVATFAGCAIDLAGSYTLSAIDGAATATSTPVDVSVGPATGLAFLSYPQASSTSDLGSISVAAVDAGGNVAASASDTVTLSISSNAGTFTCAGGLSLPLVSGIAMFTRCAQATPGFDYTITTSGVALPPFTGESFDVGSGVATRLAFCWSDGVDPCTSTQAGGATGGTSFDLQPTILVEDAAGNVVSGDDQTVVALRASGGPGTLTCWDDLSIPVEGGVAWFDGCEIDRIGTYVLTATTSTGLTPASSSITVSLGPADELVFTAQPASAQAGQPFATQPVVAIADAGGNIVTNATASIVLSVSSDTGDGDLSCDGGLTLTTVAGVAAFKGCTIDSGGTGYIISADQGDFSADLFLFFADSDPFDVSAAAAKVALAASATTISRDGAVTLTAGLGPAGAGDPIRLETSANGSAWSRLVTLTADDSGAASYADHPATNRSYRAVFDGTPDLLAASSATVRIAVRQTLVLRPAPKSKPRAAARGDGVTFAATVRPYGAGIPRAIVAFAFYELRHGRWTRVTTRQGLVNARGVATVTYHFPTAGRWYVRAMALSTSGNASSAWSPVVQYSVH
jgi:hypothetical protein